MSVTKTYRVYGANGHRQRESFCKSCVMIFQKKGDVRIIQVFNSDITGTNDYSIISITRNTEEECVREFFGQLYDGIFENCRCGKIEELTDDGFQKLKEVTC